MRKHRRVWTVLTAVLLGSLLASALFGASSASARGFKFKEAFGSFEQPLGLAVDSAGDVLVIDAQAKTISRFSPDGSPADFAALGTNLIDGAGGADETPQGGLDFGVGNPSELQISVDDSGGPTDGDIYVIQPNPLNLIDVFDPDGTYLGQLTASGEGPFGLIAGVTVDPSGAVYVSDFNLTEAKGALHKYVPVANPVTNADNTANFVRPSFGNLAAGAGATAGSIFAKKEFQSEPVKLDSATGGEECAVASGLSLALAVNPIDGHLFSAGESEITEYEGSCASEAEPRPSITSVEPAPGSGQSFSGVAANGDLVYVTRNGSPAIEVWERVKLPEPVVTGDAAPVEVTGATLRGEVTPNGLPLTECLFEYGETTAYGASVPCESPDADEVGDGTAPVAVHGHVSGLDAGTTYHFRLVAANANGRVGGEDAEFRTSGPQVREESVSQVSATSARIGARIDPNGADTGFFVEYLSEAAYLANPASNRFAGAVKVPVPERRLPAAVTGIGNLDEGSPIVSNLSTGAGAFGPGEAISGSGIPPETTIVAVLGPTRLELSSPATATLEGAALIATGPQPVFQQLNGLRPQSAYRFRLVASNPSGTAFGRDLRLTTFPPASAVLLPDGRAYEMVTPAQKSGEVIPPEPNGALARIFCGECLPGINAPTLPMQSSPDGESVLYEGQPFAAGLAAGPNEYVSRRGAGGWDWRSLSAPTTTGSWLGFSADLSRRVLWQVEPPLSPEAPTRGGHGFANLYLASEGGALRPLITVEPPQREPGEPRLGGERFEVSYAGANSGTAASPAFGHVIFEANDALTAAVPGVAPAAPEVEAGCSVSSCDLYDWSQGRLQLVNVLPGNAAAVGAVLGSGRLLEAGNLNEAPNRSHAISADGSRIFWSSGETGQVYARLDGTRTLEVPGPGSCKESVPIESRACFLTASADGSRVLLSDGEIYALSASGGAYEPIVDLTAGAGGFLGILGAAEDLSRVYFVDTAALTAPGEQNTNGEQAEAGKPNLFAWGGGATSFVGTLLPADDEIGTNSQYGTWHAALSDRTAQVTPDGRYLAFMSGAALTGFDSQLAGGGNCTGLLTSSACREVFEYDAATGRLSCASCNPSGQRPLGPSNLSLLRPGPRDASYRQPANLSPAGGGRLFFESQDALTPQDTNGSVLDVYEWEPAGVGSCERPAGCVELISSGRGAEPSLFMDSTPSGDDAYFITREQLVRADRDQQLDLYDARVGGGFAEGAAPACVGEGCKGLGPTPATQPSAGSAGFVGPGNPKPARSCSKAARQAKSLNHRAKQLRRDVERATNPAKAAKLRKKAAHLAKRAQRKNRQAKACRGGASTGSRAHRVRHRASASHRRAHFNRRAER